MLKRENKGAVEIRLICALAIIIKEKNKEAPLKPREMSIVLFECVVMEKDF